MGEQIPHTAKFAYSSLALSFILFYVSNSAEILLTELLCLCEPPSAITTDVTLF